MAWTMSLHFWFILFIWAEEEGYYVRLTMAPNKTKGMKVQVL